MQSSFTDYPQKCTVCGNLKTFPYTWNSTIPPTMCTCPKVSLSWECHRCHKINAPWKSSCDCTPSPLSSAPTANSSYEGGVNPFTSTFTDPFAPKPPNI